MAKIIGNVKPGRLHPPARARAQLQRVGVLRFFDREQQRGGFPAHRQPRQRATPR